MKRFLAVLLFVVSLAGPLVAPQGSQAGPLASLPNGTGAIFVNSGQSLGGETGNGVALGDLDGDGDTDAFVANDFSIGEANQVWFNDGNGFFTGGQTPGTDNGYDVALGDLDGDADLDALVAGAASSRPPRGTGNEVVRAADLLASRVWVNQGGAQGGTQGQFAAGATFGLFTSYGAALGDVDNDGDLDALVVGNSNQVWLNNGTASFSAGPSFPFQFSEAAALVDLDGDGFRDAVIVDSASGSSSRVWRNDGNWNPGPGTFTMGPALPMPGLVKGVAAGDLDADGRRDLFLAGYGSDRVYWNEGELAFTAGAPLPASDSSWALAMADVDGDGDLDAVAGNTGAEPNRVWRNDGSRAFALAQEFGDELGSYWSRGLGLADLNGDGAADLFEATTADDRVWFNTTTPPVVPNEPGWQVQAVDVRGRAGHSPSLAVDANGYPHISYNRVFQDPDETISYLMYARWDGIRWHTDVVSTDVDTETSLALDAGGNPHIAYRLADGTALGYAYWDGTNWQVQTVDTVSFPSTIGLGSLALDANGRPHISYNTYNNGTGAPENLKYAYWNGTAWQVQNVENGLVYESSLAVDGGGRPHIGYAIRAGFDQYLLKYALWNGVTWQFQTLDGAVADAGVFTAALALDGAGDPHIGYVLDYFSSGDVIKHAYRAGGGSWQLQAVTTLQSYQKIWDIALDVEPAGSPHLLYFLKAGDDHWVHYTHWDGATWQSAALDSGAAADPLLYESLLAMSLDAAGNLHAGYHDPRYEDLRYVTWALNWQLRTVPETGTVDAPSLAVGDTVPSIGYYNQSSGQVKLATWAEPWTLNPLDFVSQPVTDLAVAAGAQFEHASYYDADNQRLMYSYWNGAAWTAEVVDEAGNVGRYNDLVLLNNTDGSPRIAYWDDTTLRVKLALPVPNSVLWNIYPNNAGPALNVNSGPLSTAVVPGGIGVSYYDGAGGDLRLALWDSATTTWTDERVDGLSANVGRLNDLQTDWTDAAPVVAYYDETNDAILLAFKAPGGWQIQTVVSDAGGVTSLGLELGFNSRHYARIAYTSNGGTLNVAILRNGAWTIETVESGTATLDDVAPARDTRLHLAYVRAATGLQYAFRTATLDVNPDNPGAPPGETTGLYNPLDPCPGEHSTGGSEALFSAAGFTARPTQADTLTDDGIYGRLMSLFGATPEGQVYIGLYHAHHFETGQLALSDPQLLWDAAGTLQNFLPGLEALVTGHGDEVVITQQMMDDALSIWQRLAAAGSPQLGAEINARLAQYNNLQDFVGLTFDEWVLAIGVNPPAVVYLPVAYR